jgi:hypothetical protein
MDDHDAKCWLCGRAIERREEADLVPHAAIPIHRECLEDGHQCYIGGPLAEPGDVIYFSPLLFKR